LGLQSRIDIEKTSIMNVALHLIICSKPIEIKFYLYLYYSSFWCWGLFLLPFALNHDLWNFIKSDYYYFLFIYVSWYLYEMRLKVMNFNVFFSKYFFQYTINPRKPKFFPKKWWRFLSYYAPCRVAKTRFQKVQKFVDNK
jgi:hypothetical protein